MGVTLDPNVAKLAKLIGLLDSNGLNDQWLQSPLDELRKSFRENHTLLLELLGDLLQSTDGQLQGIPGPNVGDTWYPIPGLDPQILFITTRTYDKAGDNHLVFGVGINWAYQENGNGNGLNANIWAKIPLLDVNTNSDAGDIEFAFGADDSPVQLAFDITHSEGFGDNHINFKGIKLSSEVYLDQDPQLSIQVQQLSIGEKAPADIDLTQLVDIENIDANQWFDLIFSLLTTKLRGISPEVNRFLDHLFPILGLSGTGPLINWFQIPDLGLDVIKRWALQLLQNDYDLSDWLTHWYDLLGEADPAVVQGSGTRIDPKRVAFPLGNLTLWVTLAYTQNSQGHIQLYPGIIVGTADAAFGVSEVKLNLQSRLELCCITLNGPDRFEPLPTFDICVRLYNNSGELVDVDFSGAGGEFDFFGQFSIKELHAGIALDDNGKIAPKFELIDVRSKQGNWPTLDLTAGQTFIEGLEDIANSVISEQINNLLGTGTISNHAGKHIAALLGIIPPTSDDTPANWPPALVISTNRLSAFLGNPLSAIACYHAECIETQHNGAPLWRFLLEDLQALLRHSSIPNPVITGSGSETIPWKVSLYSGAEGNLFLQVFAENDVESLRPQLDICLLVQPSKIDLSSNAELQCQLLANVMHLDLPKHSECPGTVNATWLESITANVQLLGKPTLEASTGLGLTFNVNGVDIGCAWSSNSDFSWSVDIDTFEASWDQGVGQTISLPGLQFGAGLDLQWNINTLAADLGINIDDFALLIRLCLGSWLAERGGSFGFGFAALFGLFPNNDFQWPELPDFPGLDLPDWNSSDTNSGNKAFPFSFPSDWPQFSVPDWPAFFNDPWPEIAAYFKLLFSKPQWTLTTFNFLGGMLFGRFPDLSLPDWGWGNESGDGIKLPSFDDLPFSVCGDGTYENPWALKLNITNDKPVELLCWLDPDGPPSGDWSNVVINLLPNQWQDIDALIADADFGNSQIGVLLHYLRDLNPHVAQVLAGISVNVDIEHEIDDFLSNALNTLEARLNLSDGIAPFTSQLAPEALENWTQAFALDALPEVSHDQQLSHEVVLTTIENQINTLSGTDDLPILLLGSSWESEAQWSTLLARFSGIQSAHINLREAGVDPEQISVSQTGSVFTRAYVGDIAVFNTAPSLDDVERIIPIANSDTTVLSQAQQVVRIVEHIHSTHNKKVIIVAHSHTGLAAVAAAQRENDLDESHQKIAGLVTIGTPLISTPLIWAPEELAIVDNPLADLPVDFDIKHGIEEAIAFLSRLDTNNIGLNELDLTGIDATGQLQNALSFLQRAISNGLSDNNSNTFPTHAFDGIDELTISIPSLSIATRLPSINLTNLILNWLKNQISNLATPDESYTAPTHIGFGIRTASDNKENGFILKQQSRFDIFRTALTDATTNTSQYVTLPRLSTRLQLLKENGWLVGDIASNPRVRWAEFSLIIDPTSTRPNAVLHDAFLDGVALLRTELQQVFVDVPGDTFDLQATLQRLLDAIIQEISLPELNLERITCILDLLVHFDLVTKTSSIQGDQYGFNLDGWQALLNDAENYLRNQLALIVKDTNRRTALITTLHDCFGLNLDVFPLGLTTLLGVDTSISIEPNQLCALQELLAAMDLLLPSSTNYDFNFPAWIDLFTNPEAYLKTLFDDLLTDTTSINQLMLSINNKLSLDNITLPNITIELSPLFNIQLSANGIYRFCYTLPSAALNGQLQGQCCVIIDLPQQQIRAEATVGPTAFDLAVKLDACCKLGVDLELDFSYDISLAFGTQLPNALPYGYDDLTVLSVASGVAVPLPDVSGRMGELLPRFLLNSTLSTLLESFAFTNNDLAKFFVCLGLGYQRHPSGPIRLRPIDGLIQSPHSWLLSQHVLGTNIENQCFDGEKACQLLQHLANAFNISDASNNIQLPYGLSLACSGSSGFLLTLSSVSPIAISANDTLDLSLALTVGHQCQVGVSGNIALLFALPDPVDGIDLWDSLGFNLGFINDSFTASVSIDDKQLQLLPFSDWTSLIDLSDGGLKLLNTALDALLTELESDADLNAFITQLRALLVLLDLNTPAKIDLCLNNPLAWLENRLSTVNITGVLTGINNALMLPLGGNITVTGNKLVFTDGNLTLCIGRNTTKLGAWLSLSDAELGPISISVNIGLETLNLNSTPDLTLALDLACTNPLIVLSGQEISPSISFEVDNTSTLVIYPLGDIFSNNQFRLDLLPTIQFACNETCITELFRDLLLPLTLEVLLDTDAISDFLRQDLPSINGVSLGSILVDSNLLNEDNGSFDFHFPYSDISAEDILYRLLWSVLSSLNNKSLFDGAIEIVTKTLSNQHTHYGVRVSLPDATLVEDPEFKLLLGNESPDWLDRTDGPSRADGGLYFYLPTVDERPAVININTVSLLPEIELVNFGVELTGKNDQPLLDSNGFRLDGARALLYFSIAFDDGVDIALGASATIMQMGLPIGNAGGNVIGQNLLSSDAGSGGENTDVNPAFSVEISYFEELDVRLMGRDAGATEIWFPIQKTFGPIHIGQIGVKWHDTGNGPGNKALEILLDGGVSLAGLNVYVDDLGVRIPIASASDLSTWSLGLKGLGVSYVGGGVKISGALLRDNDQGTAYSGAVLVEVSGKTFTAIGSYAKDPVTSMFVFVLLPITIGGPPYFFITGLAGGFGYNRGLNVPPVEDIPEFPLIEAARGSSAFSNDPLSALSRLGDAVPVKRGSYWIAGGINFSSFELAKSTALAYILLDRGFEVGILGITRMELPEENPLVNLELALKARFSTRDGVLSVEARLSDNSWLFDRDCRLTGGFAFYVWFGGPNQGDFVITVGGYHHRFNKPPHYPDVPRLGFNWRVSSKVTIKGESYFALTPSAVMAGGLLEAVYKSGNLKAWFKTWAHFLIAWKPFAYAIGFGISIGVSYRLRINLLFGSITKTFKVELGASVEVWGPKFSGIATINWWVISFDVRFGANVGKDKKDAISWDTFRIEFLPKDIKDIISADVITGTLVDEKGENDTEKVSPWILQPEFRFSTSTVIATNRFNLFGKKDIFRGDVDIRPMHKNHVLSSHHIHIKHNNGNSVFELTEEDVDPVSLGNDTWRFTTDNDGFIDVLLKTEKAPAALWDFEDGEQKADAKTINTFTGVEIIAEIDENRTGIEKTGQIPVKDIIERGIHPLPFFQELADRSDVQSFSDTADLALPHHTDARGIFVAASQLLGPVWNDRRNSLLDQLDALGVNVTQNETLRQSPEALSRNVTSPPKIVSLYEGMANDAIPSTEIDVIEVLEIAPIQLVPLTPALIAILKQRPEPVVSVRKSQPTRVTNRVSDIENSRNQVIPRIKVNQKLSQKVFGAKLNRVSSPTQTKQSIAVSQRGEFVLSGHSTSRIRQQFRAIEKISIVTEIPVSIAPETVAPASAVSAATSRTNTESHQPQRSQSNVINAGTTQVWNLPSRNTRGVQSMMHISGNQGVKISTLNRGGVLLTEKEFGPGNHQWQPPHQTARIAITGLGKIQSEKLKASQAATMGAITLGESNNGFSAVGWQQHSQLVQVSKLTLLGRGAVIHLNAPLELTRKGRVVRQAIVDAADITRSNDTLETLLPSNVDLVCIQIQSTSAPTNQDISEAFGISSPELVLSDKPLSIVGAQHTLLVYQVEGWAYTKSNSTSNDKGNDKLESPKSVARIGTTTGTTTSFPNNDGLRVTGVFGLQGERHQWMKRLTENSALPIVENGPLSPAGQTAIQFIVDNGEQR